ncbi:MAG: prepilin-type N-terminal cleavage/methylation domain-containing protein [Candidatus Paceibacterota bacterium]|jgi:prepilin-type N-terminal cleavage/methylation domain-containing protein
MKHGFTLIELLVVIAIVGLLSTIVVASVSRVRQTAMITKTNAEINQFIKLATLAQGESGRALGNITGSGCSDCGCRARDIRNIPTSDSCYIQWVNILNLTKTASLNMLPGIEKMYRDPWGSPYCLDENEGEYAGAVDTFRSVGPDGTWGTGDDISYYIPRSGKYP